MPYNQTPTFQGFNDNLAPREWPVLHTQQHLPITVTVDLTSDPILMGLDPQPTYLTDSFQLCTKELDSSSTVHYITDVEYDGEGHFTVNFDVGDLDRPGILIGDLQILDSDAVLRYDRRCYVEVEQNATDGHTSNFPLTISELRLRLRDQDPTVNYLLDDVEFTDREIITAIRDTVDIWNEMPPPVGRFSYDKFPFRMMWSVGATALLLERKSKWMLRNHLAYSAGGVTVDDTGKWKDYAMIAENMKKEFMDFCLRKKCEININGSYGRTG